MEILGYRGARCRALWATSLDTGQGMRVRGGGFCGIGSILRVGRSGDTGIVAWEAGHILDKGAG